MQRLLCFWLILHVTVDVVTSVPVSNSRSSRMVREVYPELTQSENTEGNDQPQVCIVGDVVYNVDETVPAEQPCLRCSCRPPGIHCEATRCQKRPGCKAIHRPNSCCPEYQCECEHEGRIYANGERLQTAPGGECKVCYCRGGEVQCAEVGCYIRTDCEPRTVPGQCCPKYDHCPPKEPSNGHEFIKQSINPSSSNGTIIIPLIEVSTLSVIRETQPSSPSTSESPTGANDVETYTDDAIAESLLVVPLKQNEAKLVDKAKQEDVLPMEENNDVPKITIHEVIPNTKVEYPMTDNKKEKTYPSDEIKLAEKIVGVLESLRHTKYNGVTISPVDTVTIQKTKDFNNELSVADSETDNSEVSEVYHPTPVLKIGDQLLFLKKGELVHEKDASTPSPVITIIGAEGLQRGTEDSAETIDQKVSPDGDSQKIDDDNEDDDDTKGSESSHIVSFVKPNSAATTEASSGATISDEEVVDELVKDLESSTEPSRRQFQVPAVIHESLKSIVNIKSSSKEPGPGLVLKEIRSDFYNFTEGSTSDDYGEFTPVDSGAEASINVEVKWRPTAIADGQFAFDHETTSEIYASETTTDIPLSILTNDGNTTDSFINATTHEEDNAYKNDGLSEQNPEYPPIPEDMDIMPVAEDFSELGLVKVTTESNKEVVVVESMVDSRMNDTNNGDGVEDEAENWMKTNNGTSTEGYSSSKASSTEILPTSEVSTTEMPVTTEDEDTASSKVSEVTEMSMMKSKTLEDDILMNPSVTNATVAENDTEVRSTESTEDNTSDEMTTQSEDHASVISDENASVENDGVALSTDELVEVVPGFEVTTQHGEAASQEMEQEQNDEESLGTVQEPNVHKKDVEMIEPMITKEQFDDNHQDKHVVSKKELKQNDKMDPKNCTKGPNDADGNNELHPTQHPKETEVLQKVSDAIARFQLRETTESLDTSVLSILKDFFKTQFKYNDRK